MFTRCPACDTTFRLGAGDLRRAQGRVRCGECSSVFNALEYLAEDPEETTAPDSWLPEPANDAAPPNDEGTALAPPADNGINVFDLDFDLDAEDDDERSDGAIFVTDPDDDGFSYATRAFGAADSAATGATQNVPAQFADSPDDSLPAPSTTLAAEPGVADFDEELVKNVDEPDFSTPQEIYADLNAEPLGVSRWSEALQELEKAETGVGLTVATRSNYLSPDELDESAKETAESGAHPPALPADAEIIEPLIEEDCDDSIWERIPGVGSLGTFPGRPIDFDPPASAPNAPAQPTTQLDSSANAKDIDSDPLEFNAPEETWSDIFISSSPALPNEDAEEFPELLTEDEDEDEDATNSDDPGTGSELTVEANDDDMARLEQIFNPERIAAMLRDRAAVAGTGDSNSPRPQENAPAAHLVNAGASGTVFDNPARQLGVKAWLTDDEKPELAEDDEFPAEGYDVQHIILPDESEAPALRTSADTRAATLKKYEAPAWQANEAEPPARKGLWLAGSLLLLATLLSQLVHYNRDSLATSPVWGSTIASIYNTLDKDIFPAWSLDDYEIRSAEAVAGESAADIMDIRAQIAVVGSKPTGLPYFRVVLSDRWSKPVAEKIFAPADYAEASGLTTDRLLSPGESFEAQVSIVDPGADVQGFEIEVCMPRRHTGIACTGQPFK